MYFLNVSISKKMINIYILSLVQIGFILIVFTNVSCYYWYCIIITCCIILSESLMIMSMFMSDMYQCVQLTYKLIKLYYIFTHIIHTGK